MPSGIPVAPPSRPPRGRDPERQAAIRERAILRNERVIAMAGAKTEAARLASERQSARLEAARVAPPAPDAPPATPAEILARLSDVIRDPNSRAGDVLDASRLILDAMGALRGGARDAAGGETARELVESVVAGSIEATARARERDAISARLRAAGMSEDAILAAVAGD